MLFTATVIEDFCSFCHKLFLPPVICVEFHQFCHYTMVTEYFSVIFFLRIRLYIFVVLVTVFTLIFYVDFSSSESCQGFVFFAVGAMEQLAGCWILLVSITVR